MVNAPLRLQFRSARRAMAGVETTGLAARPSVRTGVLAAVIVSLVTLSIATFELSMGDFPSALVLMGIVPLAALLFFACLLWSVSQLLRIPGMGHALPIPMWPQIVDAIAAHTARHADT